MRQEHDTEIERLTEQIISSGSEDMASVFAGLFDLAMRIEREQFLGAGHYERVNGRHGYANGYKAKKLDTPAGTLSLNVSGLAKAFFYAGRRALLVSHWPVETQSATALTEGLFNELDRHPDIGRSEALHRSISPASEAVVLMDLKPVMY
jgi:hypothetical protein